MTIEKKLETLLSYYMSTRAAGHTTLLKRGTDNYEKPFCVLTHNSEAGGALGFNRKNIVTLNSLDRLRGSARPMAIDNGAMIEILSDAMYRIETQKEQIKILEEKKQTIFAVFGKEKLVKKIEELQMEIKKMKKTGCYTPKP
jgi:hypothetical protein